ncbi:hypothetical protein Syun_011604 [Stephania yunnanensis]|uniref:Uncharacterized protein n=1 Tax=Stephania yunnanensis TaxID=152371 RepID=A0AAP0JYK9_9MAGN
MSIRFKFRSSLAFDSVDIGPSASISVRDLKSKIAYHKKLSNNFHDFDLVIADAASGEEYGAEDFLIPSGSSVVIKRVPAERLSPSLKPSTDVVKDMGNKQNAISGCFPSVNEDIENFDDFGTDLYPVLETNFWIQFLMLPKCSESSIARCQNVNPGDLSEAICRDTFGSEGDTQARYHRKFVGDKKLDHAANANSPIVERPDLPSELRCSLCKSIFKEAVLIPCCQHSFCDKCIRLVLIEKAKCPKCLSSKCRVENLLPNLSLRLAIEHFLEFQIVTNGSDELLKYAPDEESGIHVKELSCAVSVHRRETVLPHSPSATGKGSNQVMPEPEIEMNKRNNRSAADNDTADGTGSFAAMNKSKKENAYMISVVARACYMCGSPDHFIRECPAAAGSCHMFHPGGMPTYGSPYWHGASLPYIRPFMNMYASPTMMPCNPNAVPLTTFAIPSYIPSAYGGFPVPSRLVRMWNAVPPMVSGAEHSLSQAEFGEFQNNKKRSKPLNERPPREKLHDRDLNDHTYRESQLSHEWGTLQDKANVAIYTHDVHNKRPQKKHPRYEHLDEDFHIKDRSCPKDSTSDSEKDHRYHHSDVESFKIQDSYSPDWHRKDNCRQNGSSTDRSFTSCETPYMSDSSNHCTREKKHARCHSRKKLIKPKQSGSDFSPRNQHERQKLVNTDKRRVETDVERHDRRHHSMTQSSQELSYEDQKRRKRNEKESVHSAKLSGHEMRSGDDHWSHERWEMVNGLSEDCGEDYHHHHKRNRVW